MNDRRGWQAPRDEDGTPLLDTAAVAVMLRTAFGGRWDGRRTWRWLLRSGATSAGRGKHGALLWRHAEIDALIERVDV